MDLKCYNPNCFYFNSVAVNNDNNLKFILCDKCNNAYYCSPHC